MATASDWRNEPSIASARSMRQFVCQKRNRFGVALVMPGRKSDVVADGDGIGVMQVGQLCRPFAAVNADAIRIDANQRPKEASR